MSDSSWSDLGRSLSSLRQTGLLCDLNLIASDYSTSQTPIKVHSVLLVAASSVFYKLIIKSGTVLKAGEFFQLTEVDTETLILIVHFIYGLRPTTPHELILLKKGAHVLDISSAFIYLQSFPNSVPKDTLQSSGSNQIDLHSQNLNPCQTLDQSIPCSSKIVKNSSEALDASGQKHLNLQKMEYIYQSVFTCPLCNKVFRKYKQTVQHLKLCYDSRCFSTTACPICQKQDSALEHLMESHITSRVEKCFVSASDSQERSPDQVLTTDTLSHRRCRKCQQVFKTVGECNEHYINVHDYSRCSFCEYVDENVENHTNTHKEDQICPSCFEVCDTSFSIVQHIYIQHHAEELFVCSFCAHISKTNGEALKHLVKNHEVVSSLEDALNYSILLTSNSIKRYESLNSALTNNDITWRDDWLSTKFICFKCDKYFMSRKLYIQHMMSHLVEKQTLASHLTEGQKAHSKTISCSDIEAKHSQNYFKPKSRGFICEVCGWHSASRTSLRLHLNSHTGKRPYGCEQCQASFKQPQGLQYHMKTHSNQADYKCNVCGDKFKYKQSMRLHIKRQHNQDYIRPAACTYCSYRAHTKLELSRHLTTHTHERRYECQVCQKKFSTKEHQKRHLRIIHHKNHTS